MDGGGEVTLGISLSLFGAVKDVAVQPRAQVLREDLAIMVRQHGAARGCCE